jgi:hypothetical protein
VVGLLCAMDRMETARGLPKHLKVYAVQGPYEMLFGVRPPTVPDDATLPMRGGAWLAYVSETALAAGHPVPARVTGLEDRELLAWGGVLAGFADRLRDALDGVSERTELRVVGRGAITRLESEYRASEAAVLNEGGTTLR